MNIGDPEYERLKFCAARFVLPIRRQLTPKGLEERRKEKPIWPRVITWEKWWEQKFNDRYRDYIVKHGISHAKTQAQ